MPAMMPRGGAGSLPRNCVRSSILATNARFSRARESFSRMRSSRSRRRREVSANCARRSAKKPERAVPTARRGAVARRNGSGRSARKPRTTTTIVKSATPIEKLGAAISALRLKYRLFFIEEKVAIGLWVLCRAPGAAHERSAGEHGNAALEDIGKEFRRRAFDHLFHRLHKGIQRGRECLADVRIDEYHLAREAGREAAAAHAARECLGQRDDRADRDFDLLGSALPDTELELATHEIDDVFIKTVASDLRTLRGHRSREGNNSDVGRARADIEHHCPDGLVDRELCADRARDRLFKDKHFARASISPRITHCAPLHIRDAGRNSDDDPGAEETRARTLRLADEIGQELFSHLKIRNDAVLEGAH